MVCYIDRRAIPVTNLLITGVKVPVGGDAPVETVTSDIRYTVAVEWTGTLSAEEKFVVGTVYSAEITLTARPGYTFAGIEEDTLKVGSITGTHEAGSADPLVVSITFPAAASAVVAADYSPDWDTLELGWASWASTHTRPLIPLIEESGVNIGYEFDYTPVSGSDADYNNTYAFFEVTFATGVTLADYDTVTFDWEGIDGDIGSKQIGLYAKATKFGSESMGEGYLVSNKPTIEVSTVGDGKGTGTVTLTIDKDKALPLEGNTLFVSIFTNVGKAVGGNPTHYSITNVVFSQN